jgi:predicted AlkP superfamily pyrophosphatase or phosphodiesterase
MRMRWMMVAMLCGCSVSRMAFTQTAARQVIVISIDGMTPIEYEDPLGHHLKIPNIEAMKAGGCASPGMLVTFPASTYPNHTAMMTGVHPAMHGIVSNTPIDPFGYENGGWYYYADKIVAPTLWQAAKKAGIPVGAVSWPVTINSGIDFLIPEYRPVRTEEDAALMRAISTPGLFREAEAAGKDAGVRMGDAWRTEATIDILRVHKPRLMLLHLSGLDEAQHKYGPHTPETHAELEELDADIGKIRQAVDQMGGSANTSWIIVSDHGFLAINKNLNVMVALKDAGLIATDASGKVTSWKVYPRNLTGSVFLETHDRNDKESAAKAIAVMQKLASDPANGIARLDTPEDLKAMGAAPDAFLGAEAAPGFGFGNNLTGPLLTTATQKGAHGYNPALPEMRASFLLYGAGVQKCSSLPNVRIVDVGPTAAALLGITMPNTEGVAVDHTGGR